MPNKLPKPNNSTFRWSSLLLGLLPLALLGLQQVTAQDNSTADSQTGALQAEKPRTPDPAAAKMAERALHSLQEARTRIESYDSLKADLLETVLIGTRRFQSKGSYLHAQGNRVRLELQVTLKGADGKPLNGSLLEVSNGDVMHSSHQIGEQQQITRRDLKSIFAAIEKYPSIDAELLRAKLGVGGIPALLASLERSFLFTDYKHEAINNSQYIMIGGGWKPSVLKRNRPKDADPDAPLAPYIPDYVRVYFDEKSLFPRRIFYFKKIENKLHPMMTLDFLNVQQNVPVAARDFDYYRPEDIVPTDITQQLIEQIIRSFQAQPQTESPQQNPPEPDTPPGNSED
jgi:hypothetical protein